MRGGRPGSAAWTWGQCQIVQWNANEVAPSGKAGKVKAIVVTSAERAEVLPDTPTMRESGFPELEATNWSGFVVPAATPAAVIARLNKDLNAALANAEVKEKFRGFGMVPTPSTPEQFQSFMQAQTALYARVVKEAGVKAE